MVSLALAMVVPEFGLLNAANRYSHFVGALPRLLSGELVADHERIVISETSQVHHYTFMIRHARALDTT